MISIFETIWQLSFTAEDILPVISWQHRHPPRMWDQVSLSVRFSYGETKEIIIWWQKSQIQISTKLIISWPRASLSATLRSMRLLEKDRQTQRRKENLFKQNMKFQLVLQHILSQRTDLCIAVPVFHPFYPFMHLLVATAHVVGTACGCLSCSAYVWLNWSLGVLVQDKVVLYSFVATFWKQRSASSSELSPPYLQWITFKLSFFFLRHTGF